MKTHNRKPQYHNKQQSSSSTSSFRLTNVVYSMVRWLLIIGIYVTIMVDFLIIWTEPFTKSTTGRSLQQQQQQQQQQPNQTMASIMTGPFTSLLISIGLVNPSTSQTKKNVNGTASSSSSSDQMDGNKQYVIDTLMQAGISYDEIQKQIHLLPTWEHIIEMFGNEPIILGLNECSKFQSNILPYKRMIGAAGMFSTGTNLLTQLLKQNCYIPERLQYYGNNINNITKEQLGMRWQVPWGKHTPAHYRMKHSTKQANNVDKEAVLPVVMIRNPWTWMDSMCHNPYATIWKHHPIQGQPCPLLKWKDPNGLITNEEWNEVSVKYGAGIEKYQSLHHLWNDWYNEYYHILYPNTSSLAELQQEDIQYPILMVRMEDIIFHTVKTITSICQCAGGELYPKFSYVVQSAKLNVQGHSSTVGMLEAWIKYSQPLPLQNNFTISDYISSIESIDQNLMNVFHYQQPPILHQ